MCHTLAHLRAWQGRFQEARSLARRYRDILWENGQEANWADSSECEADVYLIAGDADEAIRLLTEGQQRYDELGIADTTIFPFLANALYVAGRWEEAEPYASRAVEGRHPLWMTLGQTTLARIRARQGRLEEAEALAREAIEGAERTAYPIWRGRSALGLAEVLEAQGRDEEAIALREQAIQAFERKGATVWANLARRQTPD
jgi:tetratricopeptide (TPR) repeat protein